jgi:Protein of unknown function (DUF2971)
METAIAERPSELFHYTGIGGLEGIVKSQTLWATHAAFTNDSTELRVFSEKLPGILRPVVEIGLAELVRQNQSRQALIDEHGGTENAIAKVTAGFAAGMYKAIFGAAGIRPFVEPYITSFCTSTSVDIDQQGLLSQWRGYGQEGGYAVVFDTHKLTLLLDEERERWSLDLFVGNVVYSRDTNEKVREELGEDIAIVATSVEELLKTLNGTKSLRNASAALVRCGCRYKHWGFHEEKEVRVIAIPANIGGLKEVKPRRHFVRAGTPVPCIHLFEGMTQLPTKPLPIKRIIVGPHREKDKRQRAVEILLSQYGLDIPVSVSEIPYIGHL